MRCPAVVSTFTFALWTSPAASSRRDRGSATRTRWSSISAGAAAATSSRAAGDLVSAVSVWVPRGVEAGGLPDTSAKVVLQNWRSASNAEMFPAGFRALGLGKVIGTPTMGAVIGTGSYSLIDGSTVRTPGVGVYLADQKRTNMENYGVQPDIRVDNSPEDNLAGRDRQLDAAVEELMKQLGGGRRNQTTTNNQ